MIAALQDIALPALILGWRVFAVIIYLVIIQIAVDVIKIASVTEIRDAFIPEWRRRWASF
jgi:hypothetical protein